MIPEEEWERPTLDLDLDNVPIERTLGVQWVIAKDVFLFKVCEPKQPPTKRGILSAVSSLFDPIGFFVQLFWRLRKSYRSYGS